MQREANISCLGEFNPRAVGARTCVTIDKYLLIDFGGVAQSDRARGSPLTPSASRDCAAETKKSAA